MNYTEEQREIIRGLNQGKFSNIWEYLLSITPKEDLSIKDNWNSQDQLSWDMFFWNEKGGEKKYRFLRVNENTEKKLLDFLKVTHDLRINNLLLPMFPYGHYTVSYMHQKLEHNKSILQISRLLSDRLPTEPIGVLGGEIIRENFIPLPSLQTFIDNDFKTADELKQEEQTKYFEKQLQLQINHHNELSKHQDKQLKVQIDHQEEQSKIQKSSLNWTIKVAVASIVLSLITICLTIYNNSQPSDRNVTIKNPQDTIKVINITPIKQILKDSVKTDSIRK
ncbi:MAG: hypothetical protein HYZ54_02075 [Ignavibacteriae bacterium]|nr:hypothetical protein [Ignavibacteriota bacterium]